MREAYRGVAPVCDRVTLELMISIASEQGLWDRVGVNVKDC
jgi:hypothetical protein